MNNVITPGEGKGGWPKYDIMTWLGGGVGVGGASRCNWAMTIYTLSVPHPHIREMNNSWNFKSSSISFFGVKVSILSQNWWLTYLVIPEYYYLAKWKYRNPPSEIEFSQIVLLCWILWQVCAPLIHLGGCFRLPILSLDGIAAQKLRSPPFTAIEGSISQELRFQQLTSSFK